jgi:hypothetical protein
MPAPADHSYVAQAVANHPADQRRKRSSEECTTRANPPPQSAHRSASRRVEAHPLKSGARRERPRTSGRPRRVDRGKLNLADREHHLPCCRQRGNLAEQRIRGPPTHPSQRRTAAVREHHCQIAERSPDSCPPRRSRVPIKREKPTQQWSAAPSLTCPRQPSRATAGRLHRGVNLTLTISSRRLSEAGQPASRFLPAKWAVVIAVGFG